MDFVTLIKQRWPGVRRRRKCVYGSLEATNVLTYQLIFDIIKCEHIVFSLLILAGTVTIRVNQT